MTVDLAYSETGTGPALLILHGLFGSSSNWRGIARELSKRYTVYLVDLRNHGHSPHARGMTYPELAQDLERLVSRLGLRRFHLLGHSMGGKTAMCFALRGTHPLASLSIIDISPFRSPGDHGPILRALQTLPVAEITNRAQADADLTASIEEAGMRAFLLQNLVSTSEGYAWRIPLDLLETAMPDLRGFDPGTAPGRYDGPCLFMRGALSDYLHPAHYGAIRELFGDAQFAEVAQAGHWLHAERPAAFLEALNCFLDRHS